MQIALVAPPSWGNHGGQQRIPFQSGQAFGVVERPTFEGDSARTGVRATPAGNFVQKYFVDSRAGPAARFPEQGFSLRCRQMLRGRHRLRIIFSASNPDEVISDDPLNLP